MNKLILKIYSLPGAASLINKIEEGSLAGSNCLCKKETAYRCFFLMETEDKWLYAHSCNTFFTPPCSFLNKPHCWLDKEDEFAPCTLQGTNRSLRNYRIPERLQCLGNMELYARVQAQLALEQI
jgi:hypothetical protein